MEKCIKFDDSVVTKKILNGYKQIGVSIHLQINRLNTVIGLEHINWIFRTKELGTSTSSKNKTTYAYSSDCILQIGNRKSYTNIDGIPGSTFIPIYECRGIGYSENINQGTAEKNAITNAKKECLKCLGMLNYLYVDEDDTNEQETEQITESKSNNFLKSKLQLLSNPTINFQNVIVLKASAVDLNCNENDKFLLMMRLYYYFTEIKSTTFCDVDIQRKYDENIMKVLDLVNFGGENVQ